jgi:hypothetical protein
MFEGHYHDAGCIPVSFRIDGDSPDAFRYLVRESLRLDCAHLADAEEEGQVLVEADLATRLDRLALFARLSAEIERGIDTFSLSGSDLPHFRSVLREVLFAEQEFTHYAQEEGEVLPVVESSERCALIDALALQIGGLY